MTGIDLYWLPLGAGGSYVRLNGRIFELVEAAINRRGTLDIYHAADSSRLLVFVHGGYWRALDKTYVAFIAEAYRRAGITVAMPGYDLVPDLRIEEIADQIREAFKFAADILSPREIVVAGHSAGAQLAAMLALDQSQLRSGGPIVGFAGVSGVFDLRPLLRTSINADLGLTIEDAARASPALRLECLPLASKLPTCLTIVGGNETQGFKEWSRDFDARWRHRNGAARCMVVDGATHFSILDHIADPDDPACAAVLGLFSRSSG